MKPGAYLVTRESAGGHGANGPRLELEAEASPIARARSPASKLTSRPPAGSADLRHLVAGLLPSGRPAHHPDDMTLGGLVAAAPDSGAFLRIHPQGLRASGRRQDGLSLVDAARCDCRDRGTGARLPRSSKPCRCG